jgi:hypothetical protein
MSSIDIEYLISALSISEDANFMFSIIKIQSWIRMCLTKQKLLIPSAKYQTKQWRKTRHWYITGKSNECEKYQNRIIEKITKLPLRKTFDRIYMRSMTIIDKKCPMRDIDGFEYTENFDGIQMINDSKVYYNLKFVCDAGGAQTRALREVYHFVRCQLEILVASTNIHFINILDGDTSHKAMSKYNYLINQPKYANIKSNLFIGDMTMFQSYWLSLSI